MTDPDAAGLRQQLSPRLAMDAGIGRRLSEGEAGWTFTMFFSSSWKKDLAFSL